MKIQMTVCLQIILALTCAAAYAVPHISTAPTIEERFGAPLLADRHFMGPLLWLHGDDSEERLRMYIGKVAEGGNGSFTTESRPHTDWLGPTWFRDLGICLDAAKQHGLKMWIFDEKWWPSQSVAGKVPSRYAAKKLTATSVDIEGPRQYKANGFGGDHYVAAVAGRISLDGSIDSGSLVDLTPFIRDSNLTWSAPVGNWKVMRFTHEQAPGLIQSGGTWLSVDGASKDCVDWFLKTVYQPHYDHFKANFGKTIAGFFYDEPETRGDWGTEVPKVLAEMGVDWKQAYVAYMFKLSGDAQTAARYSYLEARAEAWGRTMYGGITRWCQSRGVKSIGHFMEHAGLYRNLDFSAGDMMRLQKYSSMGAIDAVFSQFKPGQRAAYDAPSWQTPKLGSSVTHAYGKQDDVSMVEIFGARGQDLSYPEMKWWADHMFVSGINFLIPHSFNPHAPYDNDCPPYFYNGGYEPRWPLYHVFANYVSRLNLMLTGGRHVAPVAVLAPGFSIHVGEGQPIDQISESLQDALYDCDWIPYEVFEKNMSVDNRNLKLRDESYQALVIPQVETIPYATLAKAKAFFNAGGTVLAYGYLPSKSATIGKTSTDIASLTDAIWGNALPGVSECKRNSAGGRSFLLPENPTPEQLHQALAGGTNGIQPVVDVLEGTTDHWVHALHRIKSGRSIFFITNQNYKGNARDFRVRVHAEGVPERWDAMRGDISPLQHTNIGGGNVEFALSLEPNESALIVFRTNAHTKRAQELPKLKREIAVVDPSRQEKPITEPTKLTVEDATYGVPGDPIRTRDVREKLQKMIDQGNVSLQVARLAAGDDPAPNIVKTLNAEIRAGNKLIKVAGQDPQIVFMTDTTPYFEVIQNANGRPVTLSPVVSDPFHGICVIPSDIDVYRSRVFLELEGISTEDAATVTVNGNKAGGFIGRPFRLEITKWLKQGENLIDIAPFAPKNAKLRVY